jgi:hypothetical protein
MDIQITQADGSTVLRTGVTSLSIIDNDSAAPLRAQLLTVQGQLAALAKTVSDALATPAA